MYIISKNLRL